MSDFPTAQSDEQPHEQPNRRVIPTDETEELFDAGFLESLRTLYYRLRKQKRMKKQFQQRAFVTGFTREFKDRRPYVAGDDYRALDWRLYARLGRKYIRLFEEIQEYHVHILWDRSLSMQEPFPMKRKVVLQLVIAISYLSLLSDHRVSIYSFQEELRRDTPPMRGQGHIHEMMRNITSLSFEGQTNLEQSLRMFKPARDRKAIVFVLSDFCEQSPEETEHSLLTATRWAAETHLVHILDPKEIQPVWEGDLQFIDVETREKKRMRITKKELLQYAKIYTEYLEQLQTFCRSRSLDYFPWITTDEFEETFLSLLGRGSPLTSSS